MLVVVLSAVVPANAAGVASRTLLLDAALAGGAVVVVGERGTILRSTDDAHTWAEARSNTSATLTGVSFADAQNGWVVGHDALILASSDGGLTWAKQWQGDNLADSLLDVIALDPAHVIAVGAYDLFLTTADGGKTWTRKKLLADDYHLNRITRGPSGTLYIAGEHGTLLRSRNAGADWTAIPTAYDGSFYGILPLGPQELLAYGLRGRVYRSGDDGASWSPMTTNESTLLATATELKAGPIVLAGQGRTLLISNRAPQPFEHRNVGITTGIAELLALPGGDLLAIGEAGATVIPSAQLTPGAERQHEQRPADGGHRP